MVKSQRSWAKYQFHGQLALGETFRLSWNSGKLKTSRDLPPGKTVVGLESLTSGVCWVKIANEGAVEIKSFVRFSMLRIHVVGH